MSRHVENEIPDISDPKPSRKRKLGDIEKDLVQYENVYDKLLINLLHTLLLHSTLPAIVLENSRDLFRQFITKKTINCLRETLIFMRNGRTLGSILILQKRNTVVFGKQPPPQN